jgi:hypothetical protein
MKVFVPMSDEVLGETGELHGKLVPFSPEFLEPNRENANRKPCNWISGDDYLSACRRLNVSAVVTA